MELGQKEGMGEFEIQIPSYPTKTVKIGSEKFLVIPDFQGEIGLNIFIPKC